MNEIKLKTIRRYFRVDRRKIHFLKFILEGYDGLALLSTIDPGMGTVLLYIPPGREAEADAVVAAVAETVRIEPADPPPPWDHPMEPIENMVENPAENPNRPE